VDADAGSLAAVKGEQLVLHGLIMMAMLGIFFWPLPFGCHPYLRDASLEVLIKPFNLFSFSKKGERKQVNFLVHGGCLILENRKPGLVNRDERTRAADEVPIV
jgi:hypothetical protein